MVVAVGPAQHQTTAPAVVLVAMAPTVETPMAAHPIVALVAVASLGMVVHLLMEPQEEARRTRLAVQALVAVVLVVVAVTKVAKAVAAATLAVAVVLGIPAGATLGAVVVARTTLASISPTAKGPILAMAMW